MKYFQRFVINSNKDTSFNRIFHIFAIETTMKRWNGLD